MSRFETVLPALLLAGAAHAQGSTPLEQCAAVDSPPARLACYDALAGRPPQAGATVPATPPAAAPPAPPAAADPANFGNPPVKKGKPKPERITSISARVIGTPSQWEKGTLFRLDNGQVWRAVEGEGFYPNVGENPEVTISESVFGAYWMDIKSIGRRIKVQRVS